MAAAQWILHEGNPEALSLEELSSTFGCTGRGAMYYWVQHMQHLKEKFAMAREHLQQWAEQVSGEVVETKGEVCADSHQMPAAPTGQLYRNLGVTFTVYSEAMQVAAGLVVDEGKTLVAACQAVQETMQYTIGCKALKKHIQRHGTGEPGRAGARPKLHTQDERELVCTLHMFCTLKLDITS